MKRMSLGSVDFEDVELFGIRARFTDSRVDDSSVPDGWYHYEVRGSDDDPMSVSVLERHVTVNFSGTIISPRPITFPAGQDYVDISEEINWDPEPEKGAE